MTFLRALLGVSLYAVSLASFAELLDLNSADAGTIADTMVGVGPEKAAEIVQYRDQHGPFTSLEQLVDVKGIGSKTIERNRQRVTVVLPAPQP